MQDLDPNSEKAARQRAQTVLQAFNGAYKKRILYAADHTICTDAFAQFKKLLDVFLEHHGTLHLRMERDRILYKDEVVHASSSEPTDLGFILHRDGVLWLEFHEGVQLPELETLVAILHTHCVLEEDAEDDIVTALWKYDLPSIAYKSADLELGADNHLAIEELPCRPPEDDALDGTQDAGEPEAESRPDAAGMQGPSTLDDDGRAFELTAAEHKQLADMVAAEEKMDGSDYVVDVLLYIIENHSLPEDVDDLLAYMVQAMREALARLRFSYLHSVIASTKKQMAYFNKQAHWSVPHFQRFFKTLSDKAFLNELLGISAGIETAGPEQIKELKAFLLHLRSDAINALAPLMLQSRSAVLQRVLLETIAAMARRNFQPLENLLFSQDKTLAARLVFILRFFKDTHSRSILTRLLRDGSDRVRKQALKTLLARGENDFGDFSGLIDDPDIGIRLLLLKHLGRTKNEQAEQVLLGHLQSGQAETGDPAYYLAVCRTLGKCASARSLPYLKKMMFKWPRLGILRPGGSLHRRGALAALKEMNTQAAALLIDRNGRGFAGNFLRPA